MFDIAEATEYSETSYFWWSLYSFTAVMCIPKDCKFIFFKRVTVLKALGLPAGSTPGRCMMSHLHGLCGNRQLHYLILLYGKQENLRCILQAD